MKTSYLPSYYLARLNLLPEKQKPSSWMVVGPKIKKTIPIDISQILNAHFIKQKEAQKINGTTE
jgi:hypothetical protein